ncbi:7-cyano-7-deazaguanine synthase QueC [Mesorhizobium sp. WSM3879]|uniref:7-cyano-7-deazaguanine synthase QueC n=1 Tax=Mesorhizobium sp. WSM3879 TaxID=2029406 RepID=UPI000BB03716|nr:7-cyano-7-deazaguanine synthase QueC [Mesorhizobium sp. WSM3879]PBB77822.1 7-cyano-7-deazaguanine synthase QueC [Mesorhizobium sp. WSM3879]
MQRDSGTALVLFSGGQDSTTCLTWALENFERVETIGFDYGQQHRIELDVRPYLLGRIRKDFPAWGGRLGEDHMIDMTVLGQISDTALTRDVEFAVNANGLANTFVPGRNLLFLGFAAAIAYRIGAKHLVIGVSEMDRFGYPDCRNDAVKAMQLALNLGMETRFVIHTPLMRLDKAQTWALADSLGGEPLVKLICEESHTCYGGDREHRHSWGFGCGTCFECNLRAAGWEQFRSSKEGPLASHELT